MLATEREVFDRLVFNSTLELKAAQIKKQDEDRRTPYGESFQASLQMPTEAELESFLAEGTGNDAEDEDEKKDEETTYRCLELPAAAKALLSAAGLLKKSTAAEHATSSSSTATEHARLWQMVPSIEAKRDGCDEEDDPDGQKSNKRLKPTPPSTPVPRCQHCGRVSFDLVNRSCEDKERNILKPGTFRVCRLCSAFFMGLDMLQAVGAEPHGRRNA